MHSYLCHYKYYKICTTNSDLYLQSSLYELVNQSPQKQNNYKALNDSPVNHNIASIDCFVLLRNLLVFLLLVTTVQEECAETTSAEYSVHTLFTLIIM